MSFYTTSYKKYNNTRTEYNGRKYGSKFEAGVAQELDLRKQAGEFKDWEPQYKIECVPYNCHGEPVPKCKVTHKVDFRVHHHDGSYELIEAKGFETADYKMRRKWLFCFWLPEHQDHIYTVYFQGKKGRRELTS